MAKVDISVTRSLTINTGNYESIKPTVTLTAREIDADKVADVYLCIDDAIGNLIKMEVLSCSAEAQNITKGLNQYCRDVANNAETIGQEIEAALNKLNDI